MNAQPPPQIDPQTYPATPPSPAEPSPPAPAFPPPSHGHFVAPAGPRPGDVGVVSPGEARAYAPGPRWYRLPEESWALIRAEYLAGATAKQLAVKWGVSPTSVYRHACQDGFTKTRRGEAINLEAVTRYAAQAAATEARAAEAARAERETLKAVEAEQDPLTTSGVMLRRAAALALKGRTVQAQALLTLSEQLKRAYDTYVGPLAAAQARQRARGGMSLATPSPGTTI